MRTYHDTLRRAGVLLAHGCLESPGAGARITFEGGGPSVTDGITPETLPGPGSYWLLQVASREEAVVWAARCPAETGARLDVHLVAGDRPESDLPEPAERSP